MILARHESVRIEAMAKGVASVRGTNLKNQVVIVESAALPLMRKGCRRFGWHAGDSAVYLGLFLLSLAAFSFFVPLELSRPSLLSYGITVITGLVIFFGVIPTRIRSNIIAPMGISLLAPRGKGSWFTFALITFAIGYLVINTVNHRDAYELALLVAAAVGFALQIIYMYTGDNRYFFIGAIPLFFAPLIADNQYFSPELLLSVTLLMFGLPLVLYGVQKVYAISLLSLQSNVNDLFDRALFDSPHREVRYLTAMFFTNYLEPRVIPQLMKLAEDKDVMVARTAQRALARVWGHSVEEQEEWIKRNMTRFLPHTPDGELAPESQREFEDMCRAAVDEVEAHHEDVASVFADQIAERPALIDTVITLMQGKSPCLSVEDNHVLTESMARLLAVTNDHNAFAALVRSMDLSRPAYTKLLISALSHGGVQAVPHLAGLITFPVTWVALESIESLSQVFFELHGEEGDEDLKLARILAQDKVKEALSDKRGPVRARAQWLATALPEEEGMPLLLASIQKDNWLVRGEAICALSEFSHETALPYVIQALHDTRAYVRVRALECLEHIKPKGALELIASYKNDPSTAVSYMAHQVEANLKNA